MTYVIDGYNLLHALGLITAASSAKKFRNARDHMLEWLDTSHPHPESLLVVFDARNAPRRTLGEQLIGRIRVRFAHGMIADDMIEDIIREAPRPQSLTVVSNDTRIQEAARRRACVVWTNEMLLDSLLETSPPKKPPILTPDKPDRVQSHEVVELLSVFGEIEEDHIDRRGFSAPK